MKTIDEIKTDQDYNELWDECMDGIAIFDSVFEMEYFLSDGDGGFVLCDPVNDMSQCWMLVDTIEADDWRWQLNQQHNPNKYKLQLWKEENYENVYTGWGESPQKAIILACALALNKIKN